MSGHSDSHESEILRRSGDALDLVLGTAVVGFRFTEMAARTTVASARLIVRTPMLEELLPLLSTRLILNGRRARHQFERSVIGVVDSAASIDLTDQLLASTSMQRVIEHVLTSPQLRRTVAEESATVTEKTIKDVRRRSAMLDDRAEDKAREWLRRHDRQSS